MRRDKQTPKVQIKKYLHSPGIWAVDVPVRRGGTEYPVTIRLATWTKLMETGLYPRMIIDNGGYVTAWSPTHRQWKRLARLIANCNSDQSVSIKDGNELNLLDDNIVVIDRDPVTWDREEFLTLEGGHYHEEVEYKLVDKKTENELRKELFN